MRLKKNQFTANAADQSKRPRSRLQVLKLEDAPPRRLQTGLELPKSEDAPSPSRIEAGVELAYPNRLVTPPAWLGHTPFALWIVEALKPRTIVELGVHSGNSYCAFLQAVQALSLPTRCFGVDHWRGDDHAGTYGEELYANLQAYHDPLYGAFSTLMRSSFQDALPSFSDASIDLLHIDGLHTYEAVQEDFTMWLPKMSARGIVLLHDINVHESDFGVWRLWQEITARYPNFEFVHSSGLGLAYVGHEPLPEPLQTLFGAGSDATIARVRAYFARLGSSVLERFGRREAERQLAAANAEATAQQAESKRAHAHIAHLDEQLRSARAEGARQVEMLARQLEVVNAAAATQRAESERAHAYVGQLEEQLRTAQAELTRQGESAARRLETADTAAAAQQAELERAHAHIGLLEEQLKAAQAELARQVELSARQLATADAATAAQQADSERAHAHVGQLEEQLRTAQAELARQGESAARRLETANAATAAQRTESERAHAHIRRLEEQLSGAREEIARQIETASALAAAHQKELKAKASDAGIMHGRIEVLEQELAARREDIKAARDTVAELEQKLTSTGGRLAEVVSQRDAIGRIQRQQTAVVSRLQRDLAVLENLRTSQHLAKLILVRINPSVKNVIPMTVKKFIKQRLLGLTS
jgi:polyhydroxyalkanoate synthesis regulator phasin